MFAFPSVHPHSWCGEYEHGEVQSMLQAVREAEADGTLTTQEVESLQAVRPEPTVEPKALPRRVAISDAEMSTIEWLVMQDTTPQWAAASLRKMLDRAK